ncbi:MAG: hypothetical protein NZM29_08825 [Nitrospira sp.]|nr:hypothetical protein [Nitrospira sp.]
MMKAVRSAIAMITLAACMTLAAPDDELALITALVPGSVIQTSWGWIISNSGGSTHVIRKDSGYTITTPSGTFHLVRITGGYAIAPGQRGVRELSPEQSIEVRERLRRKR